MNKDRLKFRQYSIRTKSMNCSNSITPFALDPELENLRGVFIPFCKNEIIMQSTGLTDKNNKLIYESDIALYKDDTGKLQKGIVNWWEFAYYINAIGGDDEGNQDIELHPDYLKDVEVIGNIYENKNLLENE